MVALVGYTGFVGSNIYEMGCIDKAYNSKNIQEAYGLKPDVLIYAGLRAEKYLANNFPEKDMELIYQAQANIEKICPRKLVLISTVDVLKNPIGVDENAEIECEGLQAYGLNRYRLEVWAREKYPDAHIIRLPGLFGNQIKKNFIYDFVNVIPFMLKFEKFHELLENDGELSEFYELQENGFYKCKELEQGQREILREKFKRLQFTALNFTDSRSVYQFYPLKRLWNDIQIVLEHDIRLWHPATEPISAAEIYSFLTGNEFKNELGGTSIKYDYRTVHAELFGGCGQYIMNKQEILNEIADFVREQNEKK